ncbi:MAG: hypothetical protein AAF682_25090 [Planctomycetota bacterium]
MKLRAFAWLSLAATAPLLGGRVLGRQDLRSDKAIQVEIRIVEDDYVCSVNAENAPLDHVLGKIAGHIGYDVEGLELALRPTLVTVDLKSRPLEQVLEYLLGSVGLGYQLRSKTITVQPEPGDGADYDGLLQLTGVAYLRALTKHADHPLAPGARLDQGRVAELRGFPSAAMDHYQSLIEDYPHSLEVPEAYMRSGNLLRDQERWADAATQFRSLTNLETSGEYAASSRLELARCTVELGDAQNAIFLLNAVDQTHPVPPGPERNARTLVRSLALVGLGRHLEALELLEAAEHTLDGERRIEGLRVRALALQGAGHPGDAGRAWLLYADAVAEPARVNALEQAVRLALDADDQMGALFICRQAEEYGHSVRFAPYRDEAYEALGFETEASAGSSASERIAAAELALERADPGGAAREVRNLIVGAAALDPSLRVRLARVWAEALHAEQGLEEALAYLQGVRDGLAAPGEAEHRAQIDIQAAGLLERSQLYDRAADAYRGVY